ncbi:hypothetical protein ABQD61_03120 [Enterococcus asini]|uniref:hypothetical protein n=1 Tax=Enterococcus asini TaxID=57732 RepID=UPI0032E4D9DE
MLGISHAVASLNYHRRFLYRYLILLALFLPILFLITTLKTVVLKTSAGIAAAGQDSLTQVDQDWLHTLLQNLQGILPFYNLCLLLCCGLFAIGIYWLGFGYCRQRRQEFRTFQRLGVTRRCVTSQLLLEFALPLIGYLVFLFLIMIMFQNWTEVFIQRLQSAFIAQFTTLSSMATEVGTQQSADASAPLVLQLPQNALLLVDSFQLDGQHWLHVALQSLARTFAAFTVILITVLPLSLFTCSRRWKK